MEKERGGKSGRQRSGREGEEAESRFRFWHDFGTFQKRETLSKMARSEKREAEKTGEKGKRKKK